MRKVNIAILGLGTVGGSTFDILTKNRELILKRTGIDFAVSRVLEKREEAIERHKVPRDIVTTDIDALLAADDVDIVVECIGGREPVTTWMLTALANGKSVVTPNKAVVADKFEVFKEAAEKGGGQFRFEAAVGGGIPVLSPIMNDLAGNRFSNIMGIVNGTTNYILTQMTENGMAYEDALKDAQAKGFAEADPTADVEGIDAANKLCILMKLAFDEYVHPTNIPRTGITGVTKADLDAAAEKGCVIKLIAKATLDEEGALDCSVSPTELPKSHPLAGVSNEFNAIFLTGNAVDDVMFYGKGAGPATGSAIVGDIIAIMKALQK